MYQCYGSSRDIPFIFSTWQYGGAVGILKSNLRTLICTRIPLFLHAIFRGMFNVDIAKGVREIGKFRKWVRKNMQDDGSNQLLRDYRCSSWSPLL
jgi:hypothetical protein